MKFIPPAIVVALAMPFLEACSGGLIPDWPWLGRTNTQPGEIDVPAKAATNRLLRDISVRVIEENESETDRISAFANEILSRHGFRPSATAPAVLVLQFNRPRSMSSRPGPGVGVYGRGGSSGATDLGIAIEIPVSRGKSSPAIGRHELVARLETSGGKTIWQDYAVTDAAVSPELDGSVARILINRLVEKLGQESQRQEKLVR